MINEPKYDNEYTTKSYVDRVTSELNAEVITTKITIDGEIANINKTYGAAPNPPYFVGNLYVDGTNLYRCKTERLIGAFDAADWELATEYPTTSYVDSTYTKPADFLETGSVSVNGGRITAGSIKSAHYVPNATGMKIDLDQDIIDSKNFKVNSEGVVTATNATLSGTLTSNNVTITGGSLNIGSGNFVVTNAGIVTAKSISLAGGNITWNGFNKPTKSDLGAWTTWIGPDGIYTGTLTASQVNAVKIDAGSIKTGTLSASRIYGGTLSGAAINIGDNFKVSTTGRCELTTSYGFLTTGTVASHPYVSALNIAGTTNGISFRTGTTIGDAGSPKGSIYMSGNSMYINSNNTINLNHNSSGQVGGNIGIGGMYIGGSTIYSSTGPIGIHATGTSFVYAKAGAGASGRIKTTEGDSSSKILKTNIEEFNDSHYQKAINLLKKMKLYEYDYKYNLYEDKHQYGFIIDDLEQEKETKTFFRFTDMIADVSDGNFDPTITGDPKYDLNNLPENVIKYKEYNPDVLDKYLLTCIKALQMKIDRLEEQINGK